MVVCCSSKNRQPPELLELNVCNMQNPFTRVSQQLQVIQENYKFDLSWGLSPVHHLSAMEHPCSSTYHMPKKAVSDVYLLEQSLNTRFLNNRIPPLVVTKNHSGIHHVYSLKSFHNQGTSYKVTLVVMFLVSAVLITTDFCFLLLHDIKVESKENQH